MLRLDFSEKSLAVQKGVVIEEFKQRYLNQPYGDAWLKLRPLAYQVHPYQWATIGKEISHIENAKLEDVVAFFERFYNPSNAILCLAGAITFNKAKELTEKWFGDIPAGPVNQNKYPQEPKKTKRISSSVVADVPQNAIYMAFNTVDRHHADYFAFDLLSDLLSGSESSRFTQTLVKELKLFTHVHAYITGDIDEGLFIMEGKLNDGVSFDTAEKALLNIIQEISDRGISDNELNKVKNKVITSNLFSKTSVLNKAMALCYAHLLGNVDLINSEIEQVKSIQKEDILRVCKDYILSGNFSVLNYQKQ
jgi:predicted Zn-dependent peptidase